MSLQKQKLYLPSELEKYTHEHSIIWELIGFAMILLLLGGSILLYSAWRASEASYSQEPPKSSLNALQRLTDPKKQLKSFYAKTTQYTKIETCPRTQCHTANGELPEKDSVVACPRILRLGTSVSIGGRKYRCTDRTARRFDGRFDIYHGSTYQDYQEALRYGVQIKEITILQK